MSALDLSARSAVLDVVPPGTVRIILDFKASGSVTATVWIGEEAWEATASNPSAAVAAALLEREEERREAQWQAWWAKRRQRVHVVDFTSGTATGAIA